MKILVLSSHTQSLVWLRLDMMKAFIGAECGVEAAGPDPESACNGELAKNNIKYHQIRVARNGLNPFQDLRTLSDIKKVIKEVKPDKIFAYQAKSIVYGSIAAKKCDVKEIYSLVGGLGSIFRGGGLKNGIIKAIMSFQYRFALRYNKNVILQNKDDLNELAAHNIIPAEKARIINGSGVNTEKFTPSPFPEAVTFLLIGRLIKDKGIIEYLEACKAVKAKHPGVKCVLVGPYDSNPTALGPDDIKKYADTGVVEYMGEQSDVRPFLYGCSVFVLPSYYEGTPKTVLEAMSAGRPVITTDAPGCRETVVDGENGFLVPVKNIDAIVEKMEYFIANRGEITVMGEKSRSIALEKYDVKKINAEIMKIMGII